MSVFKCKMCGGTIDIQQGESVGVCEYCGTKQTLPRLDDERKVNLYDRANHFRRNNDFDKAMGIYEQILSEDNADAEAYWSLVLCKYGIEYVEDPATHKRVPTVNRAQYTSIFADEDYKSAIQYADGYQKDIYEAEAKAIDEIQKGILEISQKEEPFDVFICYKETGADGRRTPDSVLATELYHELTREGFKVFFSRITLEDKLGTAYEPYIFAALNSAKVMVVLGTKAEHFNAVWVKNEWSRFLALIKSGARKNLIPAYKDMDPYDLPEEFSHLQAQDMSKLGFMNDLVRVINKILASDNKKTSVKETVVVSNGNANIAPLLKRVYMFLEDGEWQSADEYCEKVLDMDPENAKAYLGKLMAELQLRRAEELETYSNALKDYANFQKAVRYGDQSFKERMENYRLAQLYNAAVVEMRKATTETTYKVAAALFKKIAGYRDTDELAKQCLEKAEECRKEEIYQNACAKARKLYINYQKEAIETFKKISGYKDVDERIAECENIITQLKEKAEKERIERQRKEDERKKVAQKRSAKIKKVLIVSAIVVFVAVALIAIVPNLSITKYHNAEKQFSKGNYENAYTIYEKIPEYKDSKIKAKESHYLLANKFFSDKKYLEAMNEYDLSDDYKDSLEKYNLSKYSLAENYCVKEEYEDSQKLFNELGDYKDSKKYSDYIDAMKIYKENITERYAILKKLKGFKDVDNILAQDEYHQLLLLNGIWKYSETYAYFSFKYNIKFENGYYFCAADCDIDYKHENNHAETKGTLYYSYSRECFYTYDSSPRTEKIWPTTNSYYSLGIEDSDIYYKSKNELLLEVNLDEFELKRVG